MGSKARSAVFELLSTEQSYTNSLHAMMEAYHKHLRTEQFKLKPILPEHDIDTIFGNVEDLMVIADDLREKLERRIAETGEGVAPRVGDIMCTIAPVLKLYQKYVSHFESATQRLAECREKLPQFSAFLDKTTANGLMPLDSFLIMPVQRIPRYKLLLEEIIKHKADDDPDQPDLQQALKKVKSQADECNEATRRRENIQKLREVQSRFKGLDIAHPDRRFVREGKLCRVRSRMESAANYTFFLFDDALVYAEAAEIAQVGMASAALKLKRKFNIGPPTQARLIHVPRAREGGQLIKIVDRADDSKYRHSWEILASQKSFVVFAESAQEKEEWLRDLKLALDAAEQQVPRAACRVLAPPRRLLLPVLWCGRALSASSLSSICTSPLPLPWLLSLCMCVCATMGVRAAEGGGGARQSLTELAAPVSRRDINKECPVRRRAALV
jgi:hypothetical protein